MKNDSFVTGIWKKCNNHILLLINIYLDLEPKAFYFRYHCIGTHVLLDSGRKSLCNSFDTYGILLIYILYIDRHLPAKLERGSKGAGQNIPCFDYCGYFVIVAILAMQKCEGIPLMNQFYWVNQLFRLESFPQSVVGVVVYLVSWP